MKKKSSKSSSSKRNATSTPASTPARAARAPARRRIASGDARVDAATAALDAAVECSDPSSEEGARLRRAGAEVLLELPAGMDLGLVQRGYHTFLREVCGGLWAKLRLTRPEHLAVVISELRGAVKEKIYQGDRIHFMVAALPPARRGAAADATTVDDETRDRFDRAARAVAKLASYMRAPFTAAACEGVRFIAEDPVLVAAAQKVVKHRAGDYVTDDVMRYWLWPVLAQEASPASLEALEKGPGHEGVKARVLRFYRDNPAVAALLARLSDEKPAAGKAAGKGGAASAVPPVRPRPGRQPGMAWRLGAGNAQQFDGHARGRPPGLSPDAWPRSLGNGLPMAHVLTLRLPAEYRKQGPEIGGFSFFVEVDYEASGLDEVKPFLAGQQAAPGKDAFWASLERHRQHRHPREHRIDPPSAVGEFALIWLTERELCAGPTPLPDFGREDVPESIRGTAGLFVASDFPPEWIRLEPYDDLNVGLRPTEEELEGDGAYIPPLSERGEKLNLWETLTSTNGDNHLGGTCFASQYPPEDLSPFYLEVHNDFGGLNLGGDGTGQLDLIRPGWDWQCG
jgi:hypothetical protein